MSYVLYISSIIIYMCALKHSIASTIVTPQTLHKYHNNSKLYAYNYNVSYGKCSDVAALFMHNLIATNLV